MDVLQHLANTGIKFTYEGREYTLSPLGVGQHAELEQWLAKWPFERAQKIIDALPPTVPARVSEKIWDNAVEEAQRGPLASHAMQTVEGVRKMFYLMLQIKHPEVTEDVVHLMLDAKNIVEIKQQIEALEELDEETSEKLGNSSKSQTSPTSAADQPGQGSE